MPHHVLNDIHFAAMFDNMTEGVYLIGRDWVYKYLNRASAGFLQVDPGTLMGQRITDVFPGVLDTPFGQAYQAAMDTGQQQVVVNRFEFPDGRVGYYEVNVNPVTDGILCIAWDITQHTALVDELRETNRFQRTLLDSLAIGVARIDTNRQIVYVNPAAERILRLPKATVEARLFDSPEWVMIRESDLKPARRDEYATTRAFERHETIVDHHIGIKHLDESITWLAISAAPIQDRRGTFHGVVSTFSDITEHKQATLALRETEERYRSMLDTITDALQRAGMIEPTVSIEDRRRIDKLTAREKEVLRLVAQGQRNKEIAEELYTSETTVQRHVSNINKKLGTQNRVQSTLVALRANITHL